MINYKNLGIASQRKDILTLRATCLKIARREAPMDTGNLRKNAIYSVATKRGFKIVWDERFAYYLAFVDQGKTKHNTNNPNKKPSKKVSRNAGFVERSIGKILVVANAYMQDNNKPLKNQTAQWLGDLNNVRKSDKKMINLLPKMFSTDFDKAKSKNLSRLYQKIKENEKYVERLIERKGDHYEDFLPNQNIIKGFSIIKPQNKKSYEMFDTTDNDIFKDILKKTYESED